MPNLRSYTREALLALPAGAELNILAAGILGWSRIGRYISLFNDMGGIMPGSKTRIPLRLIEYSRSDFGVGEMLKKLRALWPRYELISTDAGFEIIDDWQKETEDRQLVTASELPHVCALALVLAAYNALAGKCGPGKDGK